MHRYTIGEYVDHVRARSPRKLTTRDLTAVSLLYDTNLPVDVVLELLSVNDDTAMQEIARTRWLALQEEV